MSSIAETSSSQLTLPSKLDRPFFAYGVFKPDELAFGQIEPLLSQPAVPATARGTLWLRDGLPLLDPEGAGYVSGFLLQFSPGHAQTAYEAVCALEPEKQYKWCEVELLNPNVAANVLCGRRVREGADESEVPRWSSEDDPVFGQGLEAVQRVIAKDARLEFKNAPPNSFDWPRFFRIQMAYLLLWSAIERFSALRYGPGLDPMERVRRLGRDSVFLNAFSEIVRAGKREVRDSRDPKTREYLDVDRPERAATYYYQVRNNLSHRGKGAFRDGELVRCSLVELFGIFRQVLDQTVFAKGKGESL